MICIRVSACWSRQQSGLIGSVLKSNPKSGINKPHVIISNDIRYSIRFMVNYLFWADQRLIGLN